MPDTQTHAPLAAAARLMTTFSLTAGLLASACGGGDSASGPTTPTQARPLKLSGIVVQARYGGPVPSATLAFPDRSVSANAAGEFLYETFGRAGDAVAVTVSAPGFVERQTHLLLGDRSAVSIDLISLASPFNLTFYRQFVRNAYESPGQLSGITRWTGDLPFCVNMTTEDTHEAIDPDVVDLMEDSARDVVTALTGGRYHASSFARGGCVQSSGTVVVRTYTGEIPGAPAGASGYATIAGTSLQIRLQTGERVPPTVAGNCLKVISTFRHELLHILGFYHIDLRADFAAASPYSFAYQCDSVGPMAALAGALAYSRSPGNLDPDIDPSATRLSRQPGQMIACP